MSAAVVSLSNVAGANELACGVWFDGNRYRSRAGADSLSYSVDLTKNVFALDNPLLRDYCANRSIVLFASGSINRLYGDVIRRYVDAHRGCKPWSVVVLPTGEENKTLANVERVCRAAKNAGIDRRGIMVAVGGGILSDTVGFAAAIYARGSRYIKVNTTLVGQIDCGVGIKTGVNFAESKNLLGCYHPAYASINDRQFLQTLPKREIRCGLAEIIKMAIVVDADLFALLERHHACVLRDKLSSRDPAAAGLDHEIVHRAIFAMMDELNGNIHERNLERKADFGHTFSPRIEVESNHAIKHGEAVAIDMALSSRIALLLGRISETDYQRIVRLFQAVGLPILAPEICSLAMMERSLDAMFLHRGQRINLVIPTGIGSADFVRRREELPNDVLVDALADLHCLYATVSRA